MLIRSFITSAPGLRLITQDPQRPHRNRRKFIHCINDHQRIRRAGQIALSAALAVFGIQKNRLLRFFIEIENIHRAAFNTFFASYACLQAFSCYAHSAPPAPPLRRASLSLYIFSSGISSVSASFGNITTYLFSWGRERSPFHSSGISIFLHFICPSSSL